MLPQSGSSSANPPNTNSPSGFPSGTSPVDRDERAELNLGGNSIVFSQYDVAKTPLPVPNVPASAITAHTVPTMGALGAAGSQAAHAINTEPQMIAEGVFIGEGRAKSGEKVFLRMERVTKANRPSWEKYCQTTAQLTLHSRSALTYAMRYTQSVADADGTVRFFNERYEELADRLGLTREEFDEFINVLGRHRFAWAPENKRRISAIHNIHAGATHLYLDTGGAHYVVYASKTADFQMPQDDATNSLARPLTFKEHTKLFGDLLICVGVNFPDGPFINSKGMFRNPGSVIENTHKGLSMVLRGFTGAVVQKYFADRQALHCKPLSSMQYMISSSLGSEDYRVEGCTHQEALDTAEASVREGQVFEMPQNVIRVSALDRLYRSHAST